MLEIINQPIQVQALFSKGILKPLKFTWRQTDYLVDKVVFRHLQRNGRALLHYFSIESNQVIYELVFNNQTLGWQLLKIYSEDC